MEWEPAFKVSKTTTSSLDKTSKQDPVSTFQILRGQAIGISRQRITEKLNLLGHQRLRVAREGTTNCQIRIKSRLSNLLLIQRRIITAIRRNQIIRTKIISSLVQIKGNLFRELILLFQRHLSEMN